MNTEWGELTTVEEATVVAAVREWRHKVIELTAQMNGLRMEAETLRREKMLLTEQVKALQQALARNPA